MQYFTLEDNRSERAKQVEILVPALVNKTTRFKLLACHGIDKMGSDESKIFHFVWVLRDKFDAERKELSGSKGWDKFINRWVGILRLPPEWAANKKWWVAQTGRNRIESIIHPCQKTIGWTQPNLSKKTDQEEEIKMLISRRKLMNTECDCFIQTSKRLIIVECKDKTSPSNEQRTRHQELIKSLKRLLPRDKAAIYIELSNAKSESDNWNWQEIEALIR